MNVIANIQVYFSYTQGLRYCNLLFHYLNAPNINYNPGSGFTNHYFNKCINNLTSK
jgi:hypothetical protein